MTENKHLTPLIVTDKNGNIIHYNEAAHDICAAVSIGENIEAFIDREAIPDYRRAITEGLLSFSLPASVHGRDQLFFDLTRERTDGIRTVYLSGKAPQSSPPISYSDIADAFEEISQSNGFHVKRRFAELYDTLIAANSVFESNRRKKAYSLRELMLRFTDTVLPRHLYTVGDVIYREDETVTDDSIIHTEPYGFYLLLCAVTSIVTYISDGMTEFGVRDAKDRVIITFSCRCRNDKKYETAADFGVRSIDLLYAETLSRVCGYSFTYEKNDKDGIIFTIAVKCHDYYPSYLKADTGSSFVIDAAANNIHYPASTDKKYREHQ